jgi:hypothetical protein
MCSIDGDVSDESVSHLCKKHYSEYENSTPIYIVGHRHDTFGSNNDKKYITVNAVIHGDKSTVAPVADARRACPTIVFQIPVSGFRRNRDGGTYRRSDRNNEKMQTKTSKSHFDAIMKRTL